MFSPNSHNTSNGLSSGYVSSLMSPISVGAPLEKNGFQFALILAKAAFNDVSAVTAISPFWRVKLLIQNQNQMLKTGRLSEPYKGITDCLVRTIRNEGFFSLWRGEHCSSAQNLCNPDRYKSDCCWKWFAGSLAAFSAGYALTGLFSYSLDYAYTRLAADIQASTKCGSHHSSLGFIRCSFTLDSAQTYLVCSDIRPAERCGEWQFNGLIDVYKKTLKSDGVAGLYHGFSISCVGYTVHTALYTLMVDPLIRPLLRDGKVQGNILVATAMVLAGFAFGLQLAYYPFDTTSKRMMMTSGESVKYKETI